MKVGLLICDHVNPELQEKYGDYSDMFARLFPEIQFENFDLLHDEWPLSIDSYDAFMATGSRHSVYDDLPWIDKAKSFIRRVHHADQCFVGCCFGHQLIGEALGGKVEKSEEGWCVGVHTFEPIGFNLLMMCQDQIVRLPADTVVLGGSEVCPNGIIKVGERILGIQAHPEFSKAYDQELMDLRKEKIGLDTYEKGLASFDKEVHKEAVRGFILNFIANANR